MGFDESFTNPLRSRYLQPLSKLLFPDSVGAGLDSQRAFVVNYCADETKNKDLGLSSHYDNAEVTLNVSLGKDFTDGELYFVDNEPVRIRHTHLLDTPTRWSLPLLCTPTH